MGSIGANGCDGGEDAHRFSGEDDRIKFLCSYGGKILPKPDGQLRYVGGDTRLVSIHRNTTYTEFLSRLEKLFGPNLCLKYQLPYGDLDTLISVTSDEDVENLIEEYDRNESCVGASRLRTFLFPSVDLPRRAYLDRFGYGVLKSPRIHTNHIMLLGFDNADSVSSCHCHCHHDYHHQQYNYHQQQQQHQQQSQKEKVIDRSPGLQSQHIQLSVASQPEYMKHQATAMDSAGHGPASNMQQLSSLVSSNWDAGKAREEWTLGNHHSDRRALDPIVDKHHQLEVNAEGNYLHPHRESIMGNAMSRVPSKDRILCTHMEGCHGGTHVCVEHQAPHRAERSKHEEFHMEAKAASLFAQGGNRIYKNPEVPKDMSSGVTTSEMLRGVLQPMHTGFDMMLEKPIENRQNSGGSDEGAQRRIEVCGVADSAQRRLEGYAVTDNTAHFHPTVLMTSGPLDNYKFQDAMDVHLVDEQHLQKHGEFEAVHQKLEPHGHHLSKGHFQQVHWQLHDSQDQQMVSSHERRRPNLPPSQCQFHKHYVPSSANTVRTMPWSDTMPNNRAPSMYMQAGIGGVSQPDSQQLPRALSPLRFHTAGSHISSRYGNRGFQMQESGHLAHRRTQQTSSVTGGQILESGETYIAHDAAVQNISVGKCSV